MDYQAFRLEVSDGVAHVALAKPAQGNPIDGQFCAEFSELTIALDQRKDVRAVLLTADGPAFSVGGDISAFVQDLDNLPTQIKRWTAGLHMGISRMQRMNSPWVAAVHAVCAGGSLALVAGCDYVLCGPQARFVAGYPGIGFSCDAGASVTLSRRMGMARGRRFLLANESLDANGAIAAGLVDELADGETLGERSEAAARRFAAGPTLAYGEIRRLFLSAGNQPLETQLEFEAQALARIAASADAREGLTAFRDKRKPKFTAN